MRSPCARGGRSTASRSTASTVEAAGPHRRRDRARPAAAAGVGDAAIDARAGEVAARAVRAYEELCPPTCRRVAPGVPSSCSTRWPPRPTRSAVARDRQPRADRAAQARRAGIGHYFPPARAASAPTPRRAELPPIAPRPARRRLAARAHGRDRRHAARHRLRPRRRRARGRGRHRPVPRRGAGRRGRRRRRRPRAAAGARDWALRADHLRRAPAAADRLGRGGKPPPGTNSIPVAAPISARRRPNACPTAAGEARLSR